MTSVVAAKLREKMAERRETINALAKRAGVGYATVHDILTGKTHNPSTDTLDRLASAYSVTSDFLLGREAAGSQKDDVDRLIEALDHEVMGLLDQSVSDEAKVAAAYTYALSRGMAGQPGALRKLDQWRDRKLRSTAIAEDEADTADARVANPSVD